MRTSRSNAWDLPSERLLYAETTNYEPCNRMMRMWVGVEQGGTAG